MSDPISVRTSAGELTGRVSGPQHRPSGLVVAIHGGTYDSEYYDTGDDSLLTLGPALGLCVVALDRPGYGGSEAFDPERLTFDAQAQLLTEAIRQLNKQIRPVRGTALVGHSIGGMIALHVAAGRPADIHGVEVSGLGSRWQPGMLEMWSSFVSDAPSVSVPAEPHADVMFGPEQTYTSQQRALDARLLRPMPMPELRSVVRWTDEFADIASQLRVPVSITFSEHDNIWMSDEVTRAAAGALFTNSVRTDVSLLRGAGHCSELHKPARVYALRQLSAVEEFLLAADAA